MGFGEGLVAVLAGDIVVEIEIRKTRFEGFHLDGSRQFVHVQSKVPVKAIPTHPVTLFLVIPQSSSPPCSLCVCHLFMLIVVIIIIIILLSLVILKQESEKLWRRQVRLEERVGIVVGVVVPWYWC